MKKLLLSIAILSCFMATAQDGYTLPEATYKNLFDKVTQLDSVTARQLADNMAASSKTLYTFFKAKHGLKSASFYFMETGLTDEVVQEQKAMGCSKCMRVNFTVYGNRYVFLDVTGSLENLLPIWKSQFLNTATPELIENSFKYREVKNRTVGVDVRLTEQQGVWQIYNWSI